MLGIDPEYFLDKMSLEGFSIALEGHNEKQKTGWNQTRIIAYWSVVPYLENKSFKNFCMFTLPFSWEEQPAKREPTKEQTEQYVKVLTDLMNNAKQ